MQLKNRPKSVYHNPTHEPMWFVRKASFCCPLRKSLLFRFLVNSCLVPSNDVIDGSLIETRRQVPKRNDDKNKNIRSKNFHLLQISTFSPENKSNWNWCQLHSLRFKLIKSIIKGTLNLKLPVFVGDQLHWDFDSSRWNLWFFKTLKCSISNNYSSNL